MSLDLKVLAETKAVLKVLISSLAVINAPPSPPRLKLWLCSTIVCLQTLDNIRKDLEL